MSGHVKRWKDLTRIRLCAGSPTEPSWLRARPDSSPCGTSVPETRQTWMDPREPDGNTMETPFSEEFIRATETQCRGIGEFGCSHYRRRCKIKSPCCNEIFDCRHCHNEVKNGNETPPLRRHDIPRHKVDTVICSLCNTEQQVQQMCEKCGVCMGKYFCGICKFFDDDTSKGQFHCTSCGICRIGGREKFFHCDRCGCCYSNLMRGDHACVEKSMHHNCPVCLEFIFDSIRDITAMPCGHTMHLMCMAEMRKHGQYACPICSKSVMDMSRAWAQLDYEVAHTPMPEDYRDRKIWILCNDCGLTSEVLFHIVGHKCTECRSYNTRPIKEPPRVVAPTITM